MSKIEAGVMDITPVEYRVENMLNDTIQLNIIRIESKPLDFKIYIGEDTPVVLVGDEMRIVQVMNNLLSNAFKYTESGTVSIWIDTEPGLNEDDVTLVMSIKDTGRGMTKTQLEGLFEEYSRYESNNLTEGTGLGLAITKQLILLMDGEINVESEPGVGSTFIVRIPQKKIGSEVLGKQVAENINTHSYSSIKRERRTIIRDIMPYGRVLVVDDVETNRYVAAGLLKMFRLMIDTAASGREAIEKVKNGNVYDVIFMDHMMPEMDGIEALNHLRAMGYTQPVVALTANVVAGKSEVFLRSGFEDFIAKPIDIRILTAVLNKYIRDKQPPDVIEEARSLQDNDTSTDSSENQTSVKSQTFSKMLQDGVDGIDIAKGFERYHGDLKVYLGILSAYVDDVRSLISGLPDVNEETIRDYTVTVHGIKGMSLGIFANHIGECARDLESAAEARDYVFIEANNQAFVDASLALVDELDVLLKAIDDENPKPLKDTPDKDLLVRLMTACSIYDINSVDEVMAEILQYKYNSDNGLAEWLREKSNVMHFPEMVDKLMEIV